MLEDICFMADRFRKTEDYNSMNDLTSNTIILCSDFRIMSSFADEILNTINGNAEYNDYWCDDSDVGTAKYDMCFYLQRVITIGNQKITLALEPSIIYKAERIGDVWFIDWVNNDDHYEEFIYPLTIFIGSRDVWNSGKDAVYEMIVSGRYGCYDGKWIDDKKNVEIKSMFQE